MSREIVQAAQGPFERAYSLLTEYMDVCPDDIWAEKNGGWPVWQQIAHAVWVLDLFVCGDGETLPPAPLDEDVARFKAQGGEVVGRAAVKEYAAAVKSRVDAWFARLTDADLGRTNAALSKKIGRELTHIATVIMLASHTSYHLGSCDAALRDHGLAGVF
ncbi:MAG: DinB family protein [Desulfovibrio sp.]|jgi:hypothetical protein|nr:DinB family protein [Desulfovibrio sp.]